MSTTLIALLSFILTISILVIFHELGHFWAARSVNIKVDRFAIGFGKTLFKYTTKKNLDIAINMIPLGGYIRFDENENYHQGSFRNYLLRKTWVVIAGPLANLILALLVLISLYGFIGIPALKADVEHIEPHSIAAQSGLKPGMTITQVQDIPIRDAKMLMNAFLFELGNKHIIQVTAVDQQQQHHQLHFNLHDWSLTRDNPHLFKTLGFDLNTHESQRFTHNYSLTKAIEYATADAWMTTKLTGALLGKLIVGKTPLNLLSGPIGIAESSGAAIALGLSIYLAFLAFLSINLAVFNLLPFPGLDGGQLVFIGIESIKNKVISDHVKVLCVQLSLAAGMILFAHIMANDLRALLT